MTFFLPQGHLEKTTLLIVALMLVIGGCAGPGPNRCADGEQFLVHDTLSFGTLKPNGVVSPEEWQEFLGSTVTPRFPRGFGAWDGGGQWRSADGTVDRETSHVLVLDHPHDDAASENAVREIISTYKARFQQEAVFRVKTDACVSF
jgi:hypothetical protein